MNILLTVIGIMAGGMLFKFAGAVAGGVIGWLWGGLHTLGQRQDALEKELALLRSRLGNEPTEPVGASVAPHDGSRSALAVRAEPVSDRIEELSPVVVTSVERAVEPQEQPWRQQAIPAPPSAFEAWLRTLFSGENLLVKLGVVILFFGVSFLVKYAAQHGLFPIELRLTAAALGGCALLGLGWRLRGERPVYAEAIQGGGIGILYLTTYAAMRLYHLVPTGLGFVILIATCALAGALAVLQDARPLAVLGSAGGFLAPELAAIGSGSHVVLFGYYAILNASIIGIALHRCWRELNLLGFACTFVVSALWGSRFYRPEYFATVEPFLVLFFLIYTALPILYARRQATAFSGHMDITLVFGTPILAFAFQAALVSRFEYGLAWSALAAGLCYLTLAGRLLRSEPGRLRNLAEAFLALGTIFATLAIPLALDGRWTAAAWSLEGAALVWAGLRQERRLTRLFGYLVLIGSGVAFMAEVGLETGSWPVLNGFYLGCLLVAGAALLGAWLLYRSSALLLATERHATALLFAWGMIWWFSSGLHEIAEHALPSSRNGAWLVFIALSCGSCALLRRRLDWPILDWPGLGLLPALVLFALVQLGAGDTCPSVMGGWFGWPLALITWYLVLRRNEENAPPLPAAFHAVPFWLLILLAAWETHGRIAGQLPGMVTWAMCAWGVVPALAVLLITRRGGRLPWPVAGHHAVYLGMGCIPVAAAAWLWVVCANLTQAGDPWPLPYLPLVNPLDGATLLALVSLLAWYRAISATLPRLASFLPARETGVAFGATMFIWLNASLLRSIHHWCGVPFNAEALFASLVVQATLAIAWSLAALVMMVLATRRGLRPLWLTGAGLLGTVVAKLFLVDLANQGSVARIVSFVVVGLLILVIGWFSPVPPRQTEGGVR
jgi:uncharacterized membrane protein